MASGTGSAMPAEVPLVREPGASLPAVAREAAVRAGRRSGRRVDPVLLRRVRDALVALPDSALSRHYLAIPGESLAAPRREKQ
jgi:hypothetical protein